MAVLSKKVLRYSFLVTNGSFWVSLKWKTIILRRGYRPYVRLIDAHVEIEIHWKRIIKVLQTQPLWVVYLALLDTPERFRVAGGILDRSTCSTLPVPASTRPSLH